MRPRRYRSLLFAAQHQSQNDLAFEVQKYALESIPLLGKSCQYEPGNLGTKSTFQQTGGAFETIAPSIQ
jgi:hypothetical protein